MVAEPEYPQELERRIHRLEDHERRIARMGGHSGSVEGAIR
ncbi:hypothetical protein ACQP1S_21435 [Micromonospora matsumotoense]